MKAVHEQIMAIDSADNVYTVAQQEFRILAEM